MPAEDGEGLSVRAPLTFANCRYDRLKAIRDVDVEGASLPHKPARLTLQQLRR
jgi:hypothetical protein